MIVEESQTPINVLSF